MNRLLTLVFLALLGAVAWFRFGGGAAATGQPALNDMERIAESARAVREAAVAKYPLLTVRQLGNGLPDSGEWRGKPVVADLNGDGKLDCVTSIRRFDKVRIADGLRAYLGDGAGGWRLADAGLAKDMGYGGADVADLNGDGRLDIVYSGHDLPPRGFLNFLGFEGHDEWVPLEPLMDLAGVSCADVALGDYDRDGAPDLAVMGFFPKTGGLYVLRNDGSGAFEPKQQLLEASHYGAIVRFADVDGDGGVELIAATSMGPRVWRWREGAWSEFADGLPSTFGPNEVSGITRGIAAADLDGDGRAELAVCGLPNGVHAPVALYRHDGTAWRRFDSGLPDSESCFDIVFARLAGGDRGLFLACQHGVVVVRCTADGACEVVGRIPLTEGVLNLGAGDVDGDGADDVLLMQQTDLGCVGFTLPATTAKSIAR
ncbi:MAG: VCBS repeat-containing protein [Planctomycetes bacterium]|nr:VCBS repeat-containing protein [Planctomycetota bacterium]